MTAQTPRIVRVEGVNHHFGSGETRNQVLFDNHLEIGRGELVVMTGPSGSGKTTLLTLIGALRTVQDGALEVLGRPLTGLAAHELVAVRRDIGFIFQLHNLFDALSAFENVKMALQLGDCPVGEMRRRGVDMLSRLGLAQRVDDKPKALSVGQRQRVAVARALVNRPRLVLADEPTAALDRESSAAVIRLFKELAAEDGTSILMVTHDNRVLDAADRIVNMVDGRIISNVDVRDSTTLCGFLGSLELFRQLSPAALAGVAERMTRRPIRASEDIVRQGEPAGDFFLLREGRAQVIIDSQPVRIIGPGDVFGEIALLTGGPRTATVRALEDGLLNVLDKAGFDRAVHDSPSLRNQLLGVYFLRQ